MIDTESPAWRQTHLIVQILPFVAAEEVFALKGGTGINLFLLDLPRLSVDIDLTYLPRQPYAEAVAGIDAGLRRIAEVLRGVSPGYEVTEGQARDGGHIDTLTVKVRDVAVKIETNATMREALLPVRKLDTRPRVQELLGFAQATVLGDADLYGGKIVAALDRQHPRDLFDVKLLLDRSGMTDDIFRSFVLHLAGHKGVIAHTLEPRRKPIARLFEDQFQGMAELDVSVLALEEAREHLVREIHRRLGDREKRFLLSVKKREPEWGLIAFAGAERWPPIAWKLHNLGRMDPARHQRAVSNLEQVLERIG